MTVIMSVTLVSFREPTGLILWVDLLMGVLMLGVGLSVFEIGFSVMSISSSLILDVCSISSVWSMSMTISCVSTDGHVMLSSACAYCIFKLRNGLDNVLLVTGR